MKLTAEALRIDPERISHQIEAFIRDKMMELYRDGVIVGLSGGIDSSTVAHLCVRSLGPDKVSGINMCEKDSDPTVRNEEDSKLVADSLGIKFETKDLTSTLQELGTYGLVPTRLLGSKKLAGRAFGIYHKVTKAVGRDQYAGGLSRNKLTARARAYASSKHRLRLAYLYLRAEAENLLVVGAANRTEYLTGFVVKGGVDSIADIMPIMGLHKPQVRQLAGYLGVPQGIIDKPPSPDLLPGIKDEDVLGSYDRLALILFGLEKGLSPEEMGDQFGRKEVNRVIALMENSRHMREEVYVPDLTM